MSAPSAEPALARRGARKSHAIPLALGCVAALGAAALVGFLLWPTWRPMPASDPATLPVSIGGTLFNAPGAAVRMKVQRRSGPQDRIDLAFVWPTLAPPDAPKAAAAANLDAPRGPIDRIFVSIGAHNSTMAPDERIRTIYPRYTASESDTQDGLTGRAFRDTTPYRGEDLFTATDPPLVTRCTRDDLTPGMCLSERRIGGADMTFRFPRAWLSQWRDVASAMDRLAAQLKAHGS
jgi:hypothetical protein